MTLTKKQIEQINKEWKKKFKPVKQDTKLMKLADKLESESVTMPVNEYISNILTDMFFPVEIFFVNLVGSENDCSLFNNDN